MCGRTPPKDAGELEVVRVDLLRGRDIDDLVAHIQKRASISTLFLSAARVRPASMAGDLADLRETLEVNFWSLLEVTKKLTEASLFTRDAHVYVVGSDSAYSPEADTAAYDLSKQLLLNLRHIGAPILPCGIRFQVVIPPRMRTRLHRDRPDLTTPDTVARSFYRKRSSTASVIRLDHSTEHVDGPLTPKHGENPLGPPPSVRATLRRLALEEVPLHRYPDGAAESFIEAVRNANGLSTDVPVAPAPGGSGYLLRSLIQFLAYPGREFVTVEPTFPMARRWASSAGYRTDTLTLQPTSAAPAIDADCLLALATTEDPIFYVTNPGGWTPWALDQTEGQRLVDGLPSTAVLILDEAYCDWLDDSANILDSTGIIQVGNVRIVVLRTLSKAHGLADIRLGYAFGTRRAQELLESRRSPYDVPKVLLEIAISALTCERHVRRSRRYVASERFRISQALPPDVELLRGWTPNLLFRSDTPWTRRTVGLAQAEIGYRQPALYSDLIEVCLGSRRANDRLLQALRSTD